MGKSERKSAGNNGNLRPFEPGPDPRRGNGPPKGQGGRPPNEVKARMAELLDDEEVDAYLRRCLRGEEGGKVFVMAFKEVFDRAHGKAVQQLQLSGIPGGPPLIIREVRKR